MHLDPNEDYQIIWRQIISSSVRPLREQAIDALGSWTQLSMLVTELVLGWTDPRYSETAVPGRHRLLTAIIPDPYIPPACRASVPLFALPDAGDEVFNTVIPRMVHTFGMSFTLTYGPPGARNDRWSATFRLGGDALDHQMFTGVDHHRNAAICRAALKGAIHWSDINPGMWTAHDPISHGQALDT